MVLLCCVGGIENEDRCVFNSSVIASGCVECTGAASAESRLFQHPLRGDVVGKCAGDDLRARPPPPAVRDDRRGGLARQALAPIRYAEPVAHLYAVGILDEPDHAYQRIGLNSVRNREGPNLVAGLLLACLGDEGFRCAVGIRVRDIGGVPRYPRVACKALDRRRVRLLERGATAAVRCGFRFPTGRS